MSLIEVPKDDSGVDQLALETREEMIRRFVIGAVLTPPLYVLVRLLMDLPPFYGR